MNGLAKTVLEQIIISWAEKNIGEKRKKAGENEETKKVPLTSEIDHVGFNQY